MSFWSSMIVAVINSVRGVDLSALAPVLPPTLVDRRAFASPRYDGKNYKPKRRLWTKTTGTTLHQTACMLGERDERWDTLGAHIGITRRGKVLWLHDFDREVIHANGFNHETVGIEFDGLYAGIEGDERTVWDDPSTERREVGMVLTDEAVEAGLHTVRWIYGTIAQRGGHMRALVAHRQASPTRRNDPGSAIWQRVALPMHRELGISDGGPGFKIDQGYPVPEAWDPSRKGIRY